MKLVDIGEAKKALKDDKRKKAKAKNAPEIKMRGSDGDYFKFSVSYAFKGKTWSFDLWAKSQKDALNRLQHIKQFPCDVNLIHSEYLA